MIEMQFTSNIIALVMQAVLPDTSLNSREDSEEEKEDDLTGNQQDSDDERNAKMYRLQKK